MKDTWSLSEGNADGKHATRGALAETSWPNPAPSCWHCQWVEALEQLFCGCPRLERVSTPQSLVISAVEQPLYSVPMPSMRHLRTRPDARAGSERQARGLSAISRSENPTALGHSTISVTADTYAHVSPAMLAGAADLLEQVVASGKQPAKAVD